MAIELVTGHAGQGHVSSADAGRLNAGICGAGKYVLDTGLKFAYSIESANLIRIASGDAINQGRHITIPQNTLFLQAQEAFFQKKCINSCIFTTSYKSGS